jgi:hypothetical protein
MAPALAAQLTDPATQRNGAVALFGRLPDVLKLAADGAEAAQMANASFVVPTIAAGAADPIGSLAPLPTPTPAPTAAVAVRQPPATQRPTGAGSSGWTLQAYETALQYEDSVWSTYAYRIPDALWNSGEKLFGLTCDGTTPEERAGCFQSETKSIYQPIRDAIAAHRTFMKKHPAARCFADAYAADRYAADAYTTATNYLAATLKDTGAAYTADFKGWDKWIAIAQSRSDSLMKKFQGYFADCR